MAMTIITLEELQNFKNELLQELKILLSENMGAPIRKWLKSNEVRRMLRISPGTLQNLRVTGRLPYTRIDGVIFYDYDDIVKMLNAHKTTPAVSSTSKKRKGQV